MDLLRKLKKHHEMKLNWQKEENNCFTNERGGI